jgi:hypothetical protein
LSCSNFRDVPADARGRSVAATPPHCIAGAALAEDTLLISDLAYDLIEMLGTAQWVGTCANRDWQRRCGSDQKGRATKPR